MFDSNSDSSLLLWLLALGVAMLSAQVSLGWLRLAQREILPKWRWRSVAVASATLGCGICGAMLLALTARGLPYPMGFSWLGAPLIWLGAMFGALPMTILLAHRQSWWALLAGTLLATLLAIAVQWGWLEAAGFRPGLHWNVEWAGAAVVVLLTGCGSSLWIGFSGLSSKEERHTVRRIGSVFLFGLAIVASQEFVLRAGDLLNQEGAVYADDLPILVPALACGVLIPMVLVVLALDLAMRRRRYGSHTYSSRRSGSSISPMRRRRRRQRVTTL